LVLVRSSQIRLSGTGDGPDSALRRRRREVQDVLRQLLGHSILDPGCYQQRVGQVPSSATGATRQLEVRLTSTPKRIGLDDVNLEAPRLACSSKPHASRGGLCPSRAPSGACRPRPFREVIGRKDFPPRLRGRCTGHTFRSRTGLRWSPMSGRSPCCRGPWFRSRVVP
jgi:hypothetical protein